MPRQPTPAEEAEDRQQDQQQEDQANLAVHLRPGPKQASNRIILPRPAHAVYYTVQVRKPEQTKPPTSEHLAETKSPRRPHRGRQRSFIPSWGLELHAKRKPNATRPLQHRRIFSECLFWEPCHAVTTQRGGAEGGRAGQGRAGTGQATMEESTSSACCMDWLCLCSV